MTCGVCCESFNRSTHKVIQCPYCPFQVCATCSERYLLETEQDAHCMSCRKAWDRQVLTDNFTQKFVTRTYKARRENLLLDRERSLMPATQPYVEISKKIQATIREIDALHAKMDEGETRRNAIARTDPAIHAVANNFESEFDAQCDIRRREYQEVRSLWGLRADRDFFAWKRDALITMLNGSVLSDRRQFVRACPYNDCKGFLSTAWKCGLCENWTCPECHEGVGPDKTAPHTCDEAHLATARLLSKDSRNCPKCAALIFKIDGCDQMYCTQCHTAFSWRRGTVETGTIHNPHYYEFQRRMGHLPRNPGDVPCGGMPNWRTVVNIIIADNTSVYDRQYIGDAHRAEGHIRWVVLPRYTTNLQHENRDLRIKYMLGDMTEDEFKKKIQQREKARLRKQDIHQVMEMLVAVLVDLFQEFARTHDTPTLLRSLEELKLHVNTTLGKVSKRWTNCAVPTIRGTFTIQ